MHPTLEKIDRTLCAIEVALLGLLFCSILALSLSNIVLRNIFASGLPFAPPLLRILVLWLGLIGALHAARHSKHIRIDVLEKLLTGRTRSWINIGVLFFSSLVCITIAWHSYYFVYESYVIEEILLNSLPAWISQSIIPIVFSLLALRFFSSALAALFKISE